MKFALNPFAVLNGFVLAGLLATAGASAMAQSAPATAPAAAQAVPASPGHHHMGQRDPAKMQAWMAKRQAEMKTKLNITALQEGAWNTFTAAMQPPAHSWGKGDMAAQRAEMAKLTTPERIDKMREKRTQRMTEMNTAMDKRGEATKNFYATLSPEQQKTFDTVHQEMMQKHGRRQHDGGMNR